MVYFVPAFLIIISYMAGNLFQYVIREKERKLPETCIIGFLFILILWEILIMPSIKLLASFRLVCRIYSALLLILVGLSVTMGYKSLRQQLRLKKLFNIKMVLAVVLILALQVACFFLFYPDVTNDYTVETVNTTLVSDLIYENHPGMGETFQYGITFRGKIVTLPLLYAYLLQAFPGEATTLVYQMAPIFVLLLNASVYWMWGYSLFVSDGKNQYQPALFVIGMGLLNICGSFAQNCIFYYQMYRGFRGETIVYTALIPYCIYLCLQIFAYKHYRSVLYLVMALLGCLCLCDYQKGFLPCIISVLICILIAAGYRIRRWIKCRN